MSKDTLFPVETKYGTLTAEQKLQLVVKAGMEMRVAQQGYFRSSPGPDKQALLRLSKATETRFDNLCKEFSE